jgi:hypothetical protein
MPGFYGVRLINRDGKFPICFVDFSDTACATMAMQSLQVTLLSYEYLFVLGFQA